MKNRYDDPTMSKLSLDLFFKMSLLWLMRLGPKQTFGLSLGNHRELSNFHVGRSTEKHWRSLVIRWSSVTSENSEPSLPEVKLTSVDQELLLKNWRTCPAINPTLVFPTLLVSAQKLQHWIQDSRLQPYLAKPSNWDFLYHVHPRIKLVQDYNETHKLLLLLRNQDNSNVLHNKESISLDILRSNKDDSDLSLEVGPELEISVDYRQLSYGYILSKLLPVPVPSAYEQIGHVAHFNLKPDHAPYGELIGQVLRETNPSIDTVVNKIGEVKGKYRTYDLQVLAGPANFETTVVEHGLPIRLNVADCYWSTRLSGERQELIRDIEKSVKRSKRKDMLVADVFCGVGAVCLLLAKNNPGCKILANDWNPTAIKYLKDSIAQNGMDETNQFRLTCIDAYDFLIDLGTDSTTAMVPDHILMNFPLEAPTFLGALRWWSSKIVMEKYKQSRRYPRFHVYTFARASGKDCNDEEEAAVDLVANELLPVMDFHDDNHKLEDGDAADTERVHRSEDLSEEFGAHVRTRLVRDVAPGKVVVCVSFSLTPKLIRYMQGDYS